jgi:hypothetical protein
MIEKSPIFITGADRSGSTLIARILQIGNINVFAGETNNMLENIPIRKMMDEFLMGDPNNQFMPDTTQMYIPTDWSQRVKQSMQRQGLNNQSWMLKGALMTQLWPVWNYAFPNARWIIVRRRTGDIIQSCVKTGYMTLFKNTPNQLAVGAKSEEEGWLWWVHQYEIRFREMIESGVNCKVVWPERMVHGDYQQIYETLEWLNLPWSTDIVNVIDPLLWNTRIKERSI